MKTYLAEQLEGKCHAVGRCAAVHQFPCHGDRGHRGTGVIRWRGQAHFRGALTPGSARFRGERHRFFRVRRDALLAGDERAKDPAAGFPASPRAVEAAQQTEPVEGGDHPVEALIVEGGPVRNTRDPEAALHVGGLRERHTPHRGSAGVTLALVPITKSLSKTPFDCGYPELNQFFRHSARKNDRLSIGKTFVAVTETDEPAGYLTVSTAQIAAESLSDELKATLRRFPGPTFRNGKLAVDRRFQGSGVGRWLLTRAFQKAVDVSQQVGLFAVLVDAIDETAKTFHVKYGFVPLEGNPLILFLPLATTKAAMQ